MLVPLLLVIITIDFVAFDHLKENIDLLDAAQERLNETFDWEMNLTDGASGNPYPREFYRG
ncbi:MAG: hypothetical protein QFX35_04120 [Candidatus Verstraetearchaeota archaeon]|nr:hypothetical protein [Candidatus Verstraetearchaeota archaeon]